MTTDDHDDRDDREDDIDGESEPPPSSPDDGPDPIDDVEGGEMAVRLVDALLGAATGGPDAPLLEDGEKLQVELRYHGRDRVCKAFERSSDELEGLPEEIVEWAADDVLSSGRTDPIRYTASVVGTNEAKNFSLRFRREVHGGPPREPARGPYPGPGPGRYAGPPGRNGNGAALARRDPRPPVHQGYFEDEFGGYRPSGSGAERVVETLMDGFMELHRLLSAQSERDQRTIDSLMDRNTALMHEHERTFQMREQLEQRTFERELAAREAEAEQARADRLEGNISNILPGILDGLMQKLGIQAQNPSTLTPLEAQAVAWSSTLTDEKLNAIASVLDPGDRIALFRIAQIARERAQATGGVAGAPAAANGAHPGAGFAGASPRDGGGSPHGN